MAESPSRRGIIRGMLAGVVGGLAGLLGLADSEAKKEKCKHGRKKCCKGDKCKCCKQDERCKNGKCKPRGGSV